MADELNNVGQGAGSGPSVPTGGAGGGTGQGTAAQPAQPAQGTQPIDQLRSAYEGVKKEFEPYQKLGLKPDQITGYQTVYQRTYDQVAAIGRQLGYPDEEIVEALREDPVATLDYLRNELQAKSQGRERQNPEADLQARIQSGINEAMTPLNQWHNDQLTQNANATFDRETFRLASEVFKQEGVDIANVAEEELEALLFGASEYLKYDDDGIRSLKYEGKTAAIAKAFNEAKVGLDKYFLARMKREGSGVGPRTNGAPAGRAPNGQFVPGQAGKKPTLDEIIDNPGVLGQRYAER